MKQALRTTIKRQPLLNGLLFSLENAWVALRHRSPAHRGREPGIDRSRHFLAAVIRVKNEARFLPEWIAHHRGIGVEHVYIYDNNSTDETEHMLKPFLDAGMVTHIRWPQVPAAPACYDDFLARFGTRCAWAAFFDADEFLFERSVGACIRTLRARAAWPAIAINWRYFGSSSFETVPSGLVTANFIHADDALDRHVKVIARPAEILRYRNSHGFYHRGGRFGRCPDGRRVFGSFVRPAGDPDLVLHHYVYRSREDYARKARGGFVDRSGASQMARRTDRVDLEFSRHNAKRIQVPVEVITRTAATLRMLGLPRELYEPGLPLNRADTVGSAVNAGAQRS